MVSSEDEPRAIELPAWVIVGVLESALGVHFGTLLMEVAQGIQVNRELS
jgi:hypothetical protein